jgi:hypothetical protein
MLQFLLHVDVTGYLLARIAVQSIVYVCSKLDKQGVAKSEANCNSNKSVDGFMNTQTQKCIWVVYFCLYSSLVHISTLANNHKKASLFVVNEVGLIPVLRDMTPPHCPNTPLNFVTFQCF